MRNANLIIFNKPYINDEAIENTIRYIYHLDNRINFIMAHIPHHRKMQFPCFIRYGRYSLKTPVTNRYSILLYHSAE